jgi:PKD repeat protein
MLYRRGVGLVLAVALIGLAGCLYIANILPVASFTVSDPHVDSGEVVSFDASGSYDPDGTIASYVWDFDDGQTPSTTIFPLTTHVFTVQTDPAEVFRATLTVTDNHGGTDSEWRDITVVVP